MPHMKAMYLPFQIPYGSLVFPNRLQGDRPKCRGRLADPGGPQKTSIISYAWRQNLTIFQHMAQYWVVNHLLYEFFSTSLLRPAPSIFLINGVLRVMFCLFRCLSFCTDVPPGSAQLLPEVGQFPCNQLKIKDDYCGFVLQTWYRMVDKKDFPTNLQVTQQRAPSHSWTRTPRMSITCQAIIVALKGHFLTCSKIISATDQQTVFSY